MGRRAVIRVLAGAALGALAPRGAGAQETVTDAERNEVAGYIAVGQRPWGLAVTRDGKELYVANGVANTVSVVDTEARAVTATIRVGQRPWGGRHRPVSVSYGPSSTARGWPLSWIRKSRNLRGSVPLAFLPAWTCLGGMWAVAPGPSLTGGLPSISTIADPSST
jgi:YVTN family beta-propeller protein